MEQTRTLTPRTAVIWAVLRDELARRTGERLTVLDIGGGTGGFAVRVAELGHQVTVIDPSPDALAILARRAEESGVADRVTALQGDLASLAGLVSAGSVDVVLCHGVLEIVDDPAVALDTLAQVLRPGGTLSLLVSQRTAAVLSRALAGHFAQAAELLDDTAPQGRSGRRFALDEVTRLLDAAGFEVTDVRGVRVFVDHVPGSLLDVEPGATNALVDLEQAVSTRPDYLPFASQVHLLASLR